MDDILRLCNYVNDKDFLLLMNGLDDEMKEYMLHAETHCSKFMMGHIEQSLVIGMWLSRRWILHRVRLWMLGCESPDPQNMFRYCFCMCIPDPRTATYGEICTQIIICGTKLTCLSKDAPALRRQHLMSLIESAKENNDVDQVKAITCILKREAQRKQWRLLNFSTRPP
jgi:hypothetical protein